MVGAAAEAGGTSAVAATEREVDVEVLAAPDNRELPRLDRHGTKSSQRKSSRHCATAPLTGLHLGFAALF